MDLVLWYTKEFIVPLMTANCPDPVATKQARNITPQLLCLIVNLVMVPAYAVLFSYI